MSTEIPLGPKVRLSVPDHVLSRKAAGETVLLSLAAEQYYSLDGVGALVWELAEAGTTFEQAIQAVTDDYDVDEATAEEDLRALIDELRSADLIIAS